jgi:hypothetical protein
MDLAIIHLVPGPAAVHHDLAAEVVADLLWATAAPADRLEHVRARSRPEGVDLVLFHRTGPGEPAASIARDLIDRACAGPTPLRGWTAGPAANPSR